MKINVRARNNARLYAVQALYQKRIAATTYDELKVQFYSDNAERHETDWDFFYRLINAVEADDSEIDEYIAKNSKDGSSDLINFVDFAVLKVAIAELLECLETPYQIIIKEYVQIAYSMGTEKGYLFVNAMLEKISKLIRESK